LDHSLGEYSSSIITTGQLVAGGFKRNCRGEKGRVRQLERRRSKEGEREVKDLLVQAKVNGRKNAPRTCPCLRWISHKWDKAAHLYQSLLSFLA
jgi:hypothetical protein